MGAFCSAETESCGERVVLGSVEEIYKASGIRLTNLHRQYMDQVTFACKCCKKTMRRVPEVLDCWFYYLHVLSVALFDRPAFQNCVVHGTVLAKDGKKLAKSSRNYTGPMQLMKQYGTDAFRRYLYQSSAMLIGDLLFDESGLQDAYQQIILPYWNACNFYISYANIDGFSGQQPVHCGVFGPDPDGGTESRGPGKGYSQKYPGGQKADGL